MRSNLWSVMALLISYLVLGYLTFAYYPKWERSGTEATISWDVSGYYMYLPAIFIYQDVKKCAFIDDVLAKYHPTPNKQQVFRHESGNYVMKYSVGQAVQFLPFFTIGHLYASSSSKYKADGFSKPYQFMIAFGSYLMAFIGLFYLLKILRVYFSDVVTAISIGIIVIGTNYLNYGSMDSAMTHNGLFTLYCLLIYLTIKFYKHPTIFSSVAIGGILGIMALTRPTELLAVIIPLLWGIRLGSKESIQERIEFIKSHFKYYSLSVIVMVAIGSLQLFYWHYVTGEWIVYSYQDQGFSWLNPHLLDGFLSYKSGWITYSPIVIFFLLGFVFLRKSMAKEFWSISIFSILFIYVTFAWDIWWYGGSIGQRAMVQAYPALAFPLASLIFWINDRNKIVRGIFYSLMGICIYLNIWFVHQAHKGGMLKVGQMTKEYYWKTIGTTSQNIDHLKLLDQDELFEGEPQNLNSIYSEDLKSFVDSTCLVFGIENLASMCLDRDKQFSGKIEIPIASMNFKWLRTSCDAEIIAKEWEFSKMTQLYVSFMNGESEVKKKMIRLQRLLNPGHTKRIFFDLRKPDSEFDRISILFWNAGGDKPIRIDNIEVSTFN